jgi:GMP synthase-like glutamine amidotransferase
MTTDLKPVRVALLDLYKGVENQGIRCIKDILRASDRRFHHVPVEFDCFDVRSKDEVPDLSYDFYISSGGPGSPFDGEGQLWEERYFSWMDQVWNHNQGEGPRKYILAICHSFQLMARHFDIAEVGRRKSDSFGILPVHLTQTGMEDALLGQLPDPFYAADFREWQVLQPKNTSIQALGASILALEKIRPHVPLERAIMAMRISPEIIGTQFHPEADPDGMYYHFGREDQRKKIVERHGQAKFEQIIDRLVDPNFLLPTYDTFIPAFLRLGIEKLRDVAIETN